MSISSSSLSAVSTRDRRLHALNALEHAVGGRDAQPLHEVVTENLRLLWRNGGKKGDDKPGLQPPSIWIRNAFVRTAAEDVHRPALARLIQSKGLQLRLYLLMLFDAQCRQESTRRVRNVRTVSPRNGLYKSWAELVLSAPDHKDEQPASWQAGRQRRERQIKEAMLALETTHRLLDIGMTTTGRKRRDFDKPTLLTEDSNPDTQTRYTVAEEHRFSVPREFFTNLWIFALTDTELACYLALRWAAPTTHSDSFAVVSRTRKAHLQLTRTTWDSVERLQAFGLIQRTDSAGRNPVTGTVENFSTKWQAGKVEPTLYDLIDEGVQFPALPTMRNALLNPVAPVRPNPLAMVLGGTP